MFGRRASNLLEVCGLHYCTGESYQLKRHYLPQVQLKSHTTLTPVCFTTQLTQTFHNANAESLPQARYTFPLYDGVAVNGYTISYDDKVLKGVVKQKEDAKQTYQAAVEKGETAGLLESLPAGVFGVTLGNVPAKTDVLVEITYCGELKHDAQIDGLRYILPTSIAPRYGQYPGELVAQNTVANGGISITVDIDMAGSAIRKVQSPSHPIAVSMGAISRALKHAEDSSFTPSQAFATLTLGSTELASDFVLQLLIDDISAPRAILETHPTMSNQRAIMATLVPKFTLRPAHPEIVFTADQSGSMGGSKNAALVASLKIFLKSLPLGVRFNICAFGSHHQFLWPTSQAYNETNLSTAMAFVDSFQAGYGGTEILQPLTAAFEQKLKDMPLEVLLLTDGEIWGESALFDYVNDQVHVKGVDARVFALGIGSDVSHTLVEGVARAGNGFAQYVQQDEESDQKVMRMLKAALYAHTKNYALEVHYEDDRDTMKDAGSDDFEIVEKVNDCLRISEKDNALDQATVHSGDDPEQDASEKKPKSFFDTTADVEQVSKKRKTTADRYAHLPAISTPKLMQAPATIPPLFPFNRTTVYLLLGPETTQRKVSSVTLRASSAEGPLELTIPVHCTENINVPTVHQLAAKKAMQDLEEGSGWLQTATVTTNGSSESVLVKEKYGSRFDELVEREAVRLGETFQVAGNWTSFVATQNGGQAEEVAGSGVEIKHEDTRDGAFFRSAGTRPGASLFGGRVAAPRSTFAQSAGGFFGSASLDAGAGAGAMHPPQMWSGAAPRDRYANSFPVANEMQRNQLREVPPTRGAPTPTAPSRGGLFGSSHGTTGGALFGNSSNTGPSSRAVSTSQPNTTAGQQSCGLFGGASSTGTVYDSQQGRGLFASLNSGHQNNGSLFSSGDLFGSRHASTPPGRQGQDNTILPLTQSSSALPDADLLLMRGEQIHALQTSPGESPPVLAAALAPATVKISADQLAQYKLEMQSAASLPLPDEDEDMDIGHSAGLTSPTAPRGAFSFSSKIRHRKRSTSQTPQGDNIVDPNATHSRTMHHVIALQTFSGAWAWSENLLALLGVKAEKITFDDMRGNKDAQATALVVAFLESKVPEKKEVWEMVVAKAKTWLGQQMGTGAEAVEDVVKKAQACF